MNLRGSMWFCSRVRKESEPRSQTIVEPLKTESTSLGAVIEQRSVRQLPLDGRNFYELSLFAPGTAPAAQGSRARCAVTLRFT